MTREAVPKSERPRVITGSDLRPEAETPFHLEAVIWHLLQSSRAGVDTSLPSHRRALLPSPVSLIPSLCELLNDPGCEQL